MNEDFPWLYVAMIVIAFISWVFNRIREFTDARKQAKWRRENPEAFREMLEEEQESDDDENWLADDDDDSSKAPTKSPDPGEALRELYEALGGGAAQPPKPVSTPVPERQQQTTPPPIRRQAVSPPQQTRPATPTPASLPPLQAPPATARRTGGARKNRDARRAKDLLRSRTGLRQAMILKEIFDDPKSMR